MAELVSSRYALALFEVGLELEKINEFNEGLNFLKAIFEKETKLLQILSHPKIDKNEKKDLINNLFKGRISSEMMNFLYILIDKRREDSILNIIEKYREIFNEHENIVKVIAITAVPMEEKSKSKLITVLSNKFNKKVELHNKVDNNVLGGVLLRIENKQLDGTIKGQLKSMDKTISGAIN